MAAYRCRRTLSFLIALALLYRVIQTGPISYRLGGWAPPWGIEYRIDYFSGFMLVTVALVVFVTSVYAGKSILGSGSLTREIIGVEGEVPFFTLYLFTHGCRRPWWPRRRSVRCCMP